MTSMKLVTQLTGSGLTYPEFREEGSRRMVTRIVATYPEGDTEFETARVCLLRVWGDDVQTTILSSLDALTAGLRALQLSDEDRVRALLPAGWELRTPDTHWHGLRNVWLADAGGLVRCDVWHEDRPTALRIMAAALRELRDGGGK